MAKLMSDSDASSRSGMHGIHDNKSTNRLIVRESSAYPWGKTAFKYSQAHIQLNKRYEVWYRAESNTQTLSRSESNIFGLLIYGPRLTD